MLGRPRGDGFGWDNEFDRHAVRRARRFASRDYKITQRRVSRVTSGPGASPPHFWIKRDGQLVSARRCSAKFRCRSIGRYMSRTPKPPLTRNGAAQLYRPRRSFIARRKAPSPVNVNFERWDPDSRRCRPDGESRYGVAQMLGNGWEWTSTVSLPSPVSSRFRFYPGYSADFFDGKHYVMKGGSPRTASCLLRRASAIGSAPDYPYVYAGFRIGEQLMNEFACDVRCGFEQAPKGAAFQISL